MPADPIIMQGRRVGPEVIPPDYEPGDYGKRGHRWWVCLPTGILGHLDERWTVQEHNDGTVSVGCGPDGNRYDWMAGPTITVTPSIHDSRTWDGWHGYLSHGVWRSVTNPTSFAEQAHHE